jgi:hypothetical protein
MIRNKPILHNLVECKLFRINTCKGVSKQMTLTLFRINTYEKTGGEGTYPLHTPSTT